MNRPGRCDGALFIPYSAWGHVAPMLSVVAELTARGLPVRVVAGPRYRSAIEAAGATAVVPEIGHEVRVPAGLRPSDLADRVGLWRSRRIAWDSMDYVIGDELRRYPPQVCVVDPHVRRARRRLASEGIPVVRFWTTYPRRRALSGPSLVNVLPELWPRVLSRQGDVHTVGPLVFDASSATAFATPVVGRGPLLVVSPGTVFARSAEFFRRVVAAFGGTRWSVVLATTHLPVRELGQLPGNVVAHRWIRQAELVRRADVLLTHAGMSSVHEAILAGTPMVTAPRSREQRRTASRLRDLGIATPMRWNDGLLGQVEHLLSNSLAHKNLQELRERASRADGPRRAADRLLEIAESGPGGRGHVRCGCQR